MFTLGLTAQTITFGSRIPGSFNNRFHADPGITAWTLRMDERSGRRAVLFIAAAFALLIALRPASLQAQSFASVSGTITDTSGAVVPGVQIVLQNRDTNVKQITLTNGKGVYSFISVTPGNYSMEVIKNGFPCNDGPECCRGGLHRAGVGGNSDRLLDRTGSNCEIEERRLINAKNNLGLVSRSKSVLNDFH